jgi:hypothetical protein
MATPIYALGVRKTVAVAVESTYGTQAAGPGQFLRRNMSTMNLQVQEIDSQEILVSQMMRDTRTGPHTVVGQLDSNLSPGTYEILFENLLRGAFTAGVSVSGLTTTVVTIAANGQITLSESTANFLTSGFKVGDVVQVSGAVSPNAGINGIPLLLVAPLTATAMTFAPNPAVTAWASGAQASIGIAVPGKKLIVPASGQTIGSLSFEEYYSDVAKSELATGCRVTDISLNIPASGYVSFQSRYTGQTYSEPLNQVYPSANAESTSVGLTATDGALLYEGLPVAVVTGMSIQISAQTAAPPVVGSNTIPNVYVGTLSVRGSLSCLMINDSMGQDFQSEKELQLSVLLTTNDGNFIAVSMGRVKLTAEQKQDNDLEITRNFNFVALEQSVLGGSGLAYDDTIISIIDTQAS